MGCTPGRGFDVLLSPCLLPRAAASPFCVSVFSESPSDEELLLEDELPEDDTPSSSLASYLVRSACVSDK